MDAIVAFCHREIRNDMHLAFDGVAPRLHEGAWVAPGAVLVGAVTLRRGSSVWYGAVLRADGEVIDVGAGTNVQDGCVIHADI